MFAIHKKADYAMNTNEQMIYESLSTIINDILLVFDFNTTDNGFTVKYKRLYEDDTTPQEEFQYLSAFCGVRGAFYHAEDEILRCCG